VASNVFPAFITDEYRQGRGFADFERSARPPASGSGASSKATSPGSSASRRTRLSLPRNNAGSLDLGVGQYRAAASAADAHATALREIAVAAERAARATGDTTESTRMYVQSARAAAMEAEGVARAAAMEATSMERLQTELNATTSKTTAVIAGQRSLRTVLQEMDGAAKQTRFAYVQMGQQFADVAVQMQMGTPIATIMVQQLTQMGFAAAQLPGKLGAVGRFFASPLGTVAILAAAAGVSLLSKAFGESKHAADEAATASELFGEAQSALGSMFDTTTGKIKAQSGFLREHIDLMKAEIRLKALELDQQALDDQARFKEGSQTSAAFASPGFIARIGASGADQGVDIGKVEREVSDAQRSIQGVFDAVDKGSLTIDAGTKKLLGMADAAKVLGAELHGTKDKPGLVDALIAGDMAKARTELAKKMRDSLSANRLDPDLITPRKTRDHTNQVAGLQEFGNDALDRANAVAGRFEDQPKAVEQARKAYAELDNIQRDLILRNNELIKVSGKPIANFAQVTQAIASARETVADGVIRQLADPFRDLPKKFDDATDRLKALKDMADATDASTSRGAATLSKIADAEATIRSGLAKPLRDYQQQQERQAQIQAALNAGHEDEADLLQAKFALMQQIGAEDDDQLQRYLDAIGYQGDINDYLTRQVDLVRQQGRAYEELQARIGPYLNTLGDIQRNIESTIEGVLNGRNLFSSAGGFIKGLKQEFNTLLSQTVTEKLFGGIFRDLKDQVQGRNPVQAAGERMATAMEGGSTSVTSFADAVTSATANIQQAADSLASVPSTVAAAVNDNALAGPTGALPIAGRITNTFSQHLARGSAGLDIAAALGTAIKAPASGKVVYVGYDARSGNHVIVDNGGGIISSFSHLLHPSSLTAGSSISAGNVLGLVGQTGHATGPHLHYRIKVNGQDVDPETFEFPAISLAASRTSQNLKDLNEVLAGLPDQTESLASSMGRLADSLGMTDDDFGSLENDVTVTGRRPSKGSGQLSPADFFGLTFQKLSTQLARGIGIDPKSAAAIGTKIGGFLQTAGAALPYVGAVTAANVAVNKMLGIRTHLGGLAGPGLNILLNSITSPPTGRSTISSDAAGNLVSSVSGNSAKYRAAVSGASDTAMSNIQRIAEALGATITGSGSVSIGMRNGTYRVDPTGSGKVKTKKGAIDVGSDVTAAVQLATLNLIQDGILGGLRAGTQRLLAGAKDLDTGINNALAFEGVFSELKGILDPVGAAVDALNKRFVGLQKIFAEAGASAEEYAQLQQLYDLERAQAIEQAKTQASSTLQDLLNDLTVNNDSFSLRDRLAGARAKYDPLAAEVGSGNLTNVDAFADAARAVEQIQRQLDGSQPGYFDLISQMKDVIGKGLAAQTAAASAPGSTTLPGSPFDSPSSSTGTDGTVSAIDQLSSTLVSQLGGQLQAVNDNLGTIIKQGLFVSSPLSDTSRFNF
jgi:murein DD-endopeptidase MepM/ murein hydrolase activator NlpD